MSSTKKINILPVKKGTNTVNILMSTQSCWYIGGLQNHSALKRYVTYLKLFVYAYTRCWELHVTPFWQCSHHHIIMKFSGVITNDQSDVHAKGHGQRSKVKVTEVNTQLNRFRTVTPVWIHIWWWNDAYSLMILRKGALLFLKVIRQISRSHGSKKHRIWPRLGVSGL